MSKPLCFIFQAAGLILFILNFTVVANPKSGSMGGLIFGLLLIVLGGIGFRKRIKKEK